MLPKYFKLPIRKSNFLFIRLRSDFPLFTFFLIKDIGLYSQLNFCYYILLALQRQYFRMSSISGSQIVT